MMVKTKKNISPTFFSNSEIGAELSTFVETKDSDSGSSQPKNGRREKRYKIKDWDLIQSLIFCFLEIVD